MSTNVTVNGVTYSVPAYNDTGYAQGSNSLTNMLIALANSTLQQSGGTFQLTADVDFGANYGLKGIYLKSRATNPSSAGVLRLGNAEVIGWRNQANGADVTLTVDTSNRITGSGQGYWKGTVTNDDAAAGYIGEAVRSYVAAASAVPFTLTETFYDVTSISLTAGDWDVSGVLLIASNGATANGSYTMALSSYSGNTTTDHVAADNYITGIPSTSVADPTIVIPAWRVKLATTTTIYMKGGAYFSAGTGPRGYGRISARRMR